jgi:DNA-binding Lrp family transcriptional regulator
MDEFKKHVIEISIDTTERKLKYQIPREKIDIFQKSLNQSVKESIYVNKEKIEKLFQHGVEEMYIVTRQTTVKTENKNTGETTTMNREVIECLTVIWDKNANDMYELDVSTRDYKSLEELVYEAFSAIDGKAGVALVEMGDPIRRHENRFIEEEV